MTWSTKIIHDLEFCDFIEIYEEDVYCAFMETGASYEMELENFEELEYEDYLKGHGQWARKPPEKAIKVKELSGTQCT